MNPETGTFHKISSFKDAFNRKLKLEDETPPDVQEATQDFIVIDGHAIRLPDSWPRFSIDQNIQIKGRSFKIVKIKNARLEIKGQISGFQEGENIQIQGYNGYSFRIMKIKNGIMKLKPCNNDVYKELNNASENEQVRSKEGN